MQDFRYKTSLRVIKCTLSPLLTGDFRLVMGVGITLWILIAGTWWIAMLTWEVATLSFTMHCDACFVATPASRIEDVTFTLDVKRCMVTVTLISSRSCFVSSYTLYFLSKNRACFELSADAWAWCYIEQHCARNCVRAPFCGGAPFKSSFSAIFLLAGDKTIAWERHDRCVILQLPAAVLPCTKASLNRELSLWQRPGPQKADHVPLWMLLC